MAIGLSTYAFFWRGSEQVETPMTLEAMLEETAELGGKVFQICDYPAIETFDEPRLTALRDRAHALGIVLELGTRGIAPKHLERYLTLARVLGVRLIRSMLYSGEDRPTFDQAIQRLEQILPALRQQQVTLALETYEQVSIETLMTVIETVDDDHIGVCLDPGNCVAALEMPEAVIARTAGRVVNLHLKDFAFSRAPGWVGFQLIGCPMGEGLLPLETMREAVNPQARGINEIIEHWLPWQQDEATTCALEAQWTRHNMTFLRSHHG
ncbi:sugar phosphate isomerase/epimerase family protein [Kushneria marisflavi]|uniref:Sugar phosphate isomerase n=1 Tax=Kushneria marisflavi TaxID=157779 RepID=A0A240UP21_9GAMM|nr:sugar phosphate isomerase/epimerase family protein [Kushneria marisflavi]ART63228.1 sugar phosphate isomerase [Kushneria marisflavi]RKD84257.1 sugar phosphate isomerase/epimerase [Kushneria marisflavi]